MATKVKGNKSGKTWLSTISGVNIMGPAREAANLITDNEGTQKMLRASAAAAMLVIGKACAKTGEIESVNHAAHWYEVQRIENGIQASTASKEASQLRTICRACFGGIKVQAKLEENEELYTHEFAALARKITPKDYLKSVKQGSGGHEKTKVTDNEFAKMVKWARLLSPKQRKVLDTIFAKVDAQASGKVTDIKAARDQRKAA